MRGIPVAIALVFLVLWELWSFRINRQQESMQYFVACAIEIKWATVAEQPLATSCVAHSV